MELVLGPADVFVLVQQACWGTASVSNDFVPLCRQLNMGACLKSVLTIVSSSDLKPPKFEAKQRSRALEKNAARPTGGTPAHGLSH